MKEKINDGLEHNSNQNIVDELQNGLGKIDQSFSVDTPDLIWFEQIVTEEKQRLYNALIRDLVLFWVVALIVSSGSLMMLYYRPVVYLLIQVIALIMPVILFNKGKQVEVK